MGATIGQDRRVGRLISRFEKCYGLFRHRLHCYRLEKDIDYRLVKKVTLDYWPL